MKMWKMVLTGTALSATLFVPKGPELRQATLPENTPVKLAHLKVEKVIPTEFVSRSPISAYTVAQKPLQGLRIAVDAGHGGQARWDKVLYCGGTVGVVTGQTESDVNLRVSLMLREYLCAAGADVVMTRIDDVRVTGQNGGKSDELDSRKNLANQKKADFFISVHHNEAISEGTNYTAVFYPSGTANSITLADNVSNAVSRYMGIQNVGAKPGSYRVLNGLSMPGIIVEASFMSNANEDRRLLSLAYNKLEAKAIATGVLNYVRMSKGREVDFNTIFAPIDENSANAQTVADATFVRRQIVEKKSLFGVRYEELTYDGAGNVTDVRVVGSDSPAKKKIASVAKKAVSTTSKAASKVKEVTKKAPKKVAEVAKSTKKTVSSKSTSSKSSSKSSSSKSSSKKSSKS